MILKIIIFLLSISMFLSLKTSLRFFHSSLYSSGMVRRGAGRRASMTTTTTSSSTSSPCSGHYPDSPRSYLHSEGFHTVQEILFFDGKTRCLIVSCPSPDQFDNQFYETTATTVAAGGGGGDSSQKEEVEVYAQELDSSMFSAKPSKRFVVHVGGRIALRRAWKHFHLLPPLPPNPSVVEEERGLIERSIYGAPLLPWGYLASISHKDLFAAAACARGNRHYHSLGIDLERKTNKAHAQLQARLLTLAEQETVGQYADLPSELDVMLRFSFKEAIYKALHPWLLRYIEFKEAEVFPRPDGSAEVKLRLKGLEEPAVSKEVFGCKARWVTFESYVLTLVELTRKD